MNQRLETTKKRVRQLKLDAFLVTSLVNVRYLFGFTGSNALVLVTPDHSFFVTDRRYTQQSKEQVREAEIIICKKDLLGELTKTKALQPGITLGFEALDLNVKNYLQLRKKFPEVKLMASERVVERVASIKEAAEVNNVKSAAKICLKTFEEVVKKIRPGMSELEISAELSYRTMLGGSERDPFEPIVASGFRSALPHGVSSSKKLQPGDLVIVDFGAVVNGYAADFTRTLVLGEPSSRQSEMADAVHSALAVSEQSARPGMSGKELDQVAREHLQKKGYGEFFQHSLGHGLGLEVHGLPRIGERSQDPLEVGNVITLEPGVYLPEVGGIRIEDDFLMTQQGLENLTPFPRELICVE